MEDDIERRPELKAIRTIYDIFPTIPRRPPNEVPRRVPRPALFAGQKARVIINLVKS